MKKNFAKAQLKCDKLVEKAREALFAGKTDKAQKLIGKKNKLKEKMLSWKLSEIT